MDQPRFASLARAVLCGAELWVQGAEGGPASHTVFDFAEVEFYECSAAHPDPFTHCHPLQEKKDQWYFHRASKKPGSKYKAGTRMGLDIARGAPGVPFGILVRALRIQDTGVLVEGPCNCVRAILAAAGAGTIYELVDRMPSLGVGDKSSPLCILRRGEPEGDAAALLAGPRIGLRARGDPAKEKYVNRPYRFVLKSSGVKKMARTLKPVA